MIDETLRWYLGRADVALDAAQVASGVPLALIGDRWDDVTGFADRIAPERPVVDLRQRTPSARELRKLFGEHLDTIILAGRPGRVIEAIGLLAQPWYLRVSPLSARPDEAVSLLRRAVADLGVSRRLEALGTEVAIGLDAYTWPRGLREIREVSWRIGAILDGGSMSAGARRLDVSRQALTKYLARRNV